MTSRAPGISIPPFSPPPPPPLSLVAGVRFSAALPMQNFDQLDAKLASISDPKSAEYGNWMTQAQVRL
jgi:hypothetical protein